MVKKTLKYLQVTKANYSIEVKLELFTVWFAKIKPVTWESPGMGIEVKLELFTVWFAKIKPVTWESPGWDGEQNLSEKEDWNH